MPSPSQASTGLIMSRLFLYHLYMWLPTAATEQGEEKKNMICWDMRYSFKKKLGWFIMLKHE